MIDVVALCLAFLLFQPASCKIDRSFELWSGSRKYHAPSMSTCEVFIRSGSEIRPDDRLIWDHSQDLAVYLVLDPTWKHLCSRELGKMMHDRCGERLYSNLIPKLYPDGKCRTVIWIVPAGKKSWRPPLVKNRPRLDTIARAMGCITEVIRECKNCAGVSAPFECVSCPSMD